MTGSKVSKKHLALAGMGFLLAVALIAGGSKCVLPQGLDATATDSVEQKRPDSDSASCDGNGTEKQVADEAGAVNGEGEGGTVSRAERGPASSAPAHAAKDSGVGSPSNGKPTPKGGGDGSDGSGQKHSHSWIPQTVMVHHDAKYDYVYHDAVTEGALVCNHCNARFDSVDAWGTHIDAYINEYLATNPPFEDGSHTILVPNASYRTESVIVQPAWEERVLVSEAWDEVVAAGSVCSGCGAVK